METEEQTLEREQNERGVLDAVGHYSVPTECLSRLCLRLFKITTRKVLLMAQKFNTGWAVGMVKNLEKRKSVAGQFVVKHKTVTFC